MLSIDQHARGFAGDFLRAGPERLQVISAYLAMKPPARSEMEAVGEFLSTADHNAILSAVVGDVPRGFRRALSRIGGTVQDQRCYSLLHQTLSRPPSTEVQDCIYRLPDIDRQKLLIARLLPPNLCRPNVVNAIKGMSNTNSVSVANDVSTAFALLTSRGVDPEALTQAICRVRSERELMNLWQRWLAKAECPEHPIPGSASYKSLTSGEELREASLRYKNCSFKRYLVQFVEGTDAFAEFDHEGKGSMVHLRFSEGLWRFEGVYGPRNARPSSSLREALTGHLERYGVVVPSSARRKSSDWDCIRRLARCHMMDFEFEM